MSENKKLEEGSKVMIDFLKLKKITEEVIIKSGQEVIPAVAQDVETREVLVIAYANLEALVYSLENKAVAFWSTSRNELWVIGSTSGRVFELIEIRVNCEQNSLLYLIRSVNARGACHTKDKDGRNRKSCFYRSIVLVDGKLTLAKEGEKA